MNVDLDNLEEYIELVYKVTLQTGIAKSVESFREGRGRKCRFNRLTGADLNGRNSYQVSLVSSRSRNCPFSLQRRWDCCLGIPMKIGLAKVSMRRRALLLSIV